MATQDQHNENETVDNSNKRQRTDQSENESDIQMQDGFNVEMEIGLRASEWDVAYKAAKEACEEGSERFHEWARKTAKALWEKRREEGKAMLLGGEVEWEVNEVINEEEEEGREVEEEKEIEDRTPPVQQRRRREVDEDFRLDGENNSEPSTPPINNYRKNNNANSSPLSGRSSGSRSSQRRPASSASYVTVNDSDLDEENGNSDEDVTQRTGKHMGKIADEAVRRKKDIPNALERSERINIEMDRKELELMGLRVTLKDKLSMDQVIEAISSIGVPVMVNHPLHKVYPGRGHGVVVCRSYEHAKRLKKLISTSMKFINYKHINDFTPYISIKVTGGNGLENRVIVEAVQTELDTEIIGGFFENKEMGYVYLDSQDASLVEKVAKTDFIRIKVGTKHFVLNFTVADGIKTSHQNFHEPDQRAAFFTGLPFPVPEASLLEKVNEKGIKAVRVTFFRSKTTRAILTYGLLHFDSVADTEAAINLSNRFNIMGSLFTIRANSKPKKPSFNQDRKPQLQWDEGRNELQYNDEWENRNVQTQGSQRRPRH